MNARLLIALVGLCLAETADGQTLLRWKLMPGEALVVDVRQQTVTDVAFSGKSAHTTIELGMRLGWSVTAADDAGLTVKQSVEQITFKVDSEKAGLVEYDSAAQTRPTGQARAVAEAVKPLLGAEVEIVMNARGEVQSAKPANDAAEKLFGLATAADPGVFSPAAVQKLLQQPLVVLPEKAVAEGDTWTAATDLTIASGAFQQTTTYKLAALQQREGEQLARIEIAAKLEPKAAAAAAKAGPPKLTLKSHEQTGHVLFSVESGKLAEAQQKQKLVTERPYRETTIVVTLDSTQTTSITAR